MRPKSLTHIYQTIAHLEQGTFPGSNIPLIVRVEFFKGGRVFKLWQIHMLY